MRTCLSIGLGLGEGMNPDGASTPPPGVPQNLVATPGDGLVDLQWDAVDGATGYNIYRDSVRIRTNYGDVDFEDTGLDNGTEYSYTVSAVNGAGESNQSDPATATPSSGGLTALDPVTDLASVDDGSENDSITWTDPASVPVHLHLVVTRDTGSGPVEVVNTTLAAGASQPYLVPGIGTYAGTITNIGDGITTTDSTDATFSGVTVAEASISAFSDLSGLNFIWAGDNQSGSEGDPQSILQDSSGNGYVSQTASSGVSPLLRLAYGPNGNNGLEFDGVDDTIFTSGAIAGGTAQGQTFVFVTDLDCALLGRFTAANQYGLGGSVSDWCLNHVEGEFGILRYPHLESFPQYPPETGLHSYVISSDDNGYEIMIDGVHQGRRPGSPRGTDYICIGSAGQGSGFAKQVMLVCVSYSEAHGGVSMKALARLCHDIYGSPYSDATSNRGASAWAWDAALNLTNSNAWEDTSVQEPSVVQFSDGTFAMTYTGGWDNAAVGYATSPDGVDWTRNSNPIVGQGYGGESGWAARSDLTIDPRDATENTLQLCYSDTTSGGGSIRQMTSTDRGATWSAPATILDKSLAPSGAAPQGWANSTTIYESDGTTVRKWVEQHTNANSWAITAMVSTDGGATYSTPVVVPELQRRTGCMFGGPFVFKVGARYWMAYHAVFANDSGGLTPTDIYLAFSDDATSWTLIPNPLIYMSDCPQLGSFTLPNQIADACLIPLLDGTTAIYGDIVDNDNHHGAIWRATLPYQLTS